MISIYLGKRGQADKMSGSILLYTDCLSRNLAARVDKDVDSHTLAG